MELLKKVRELIDNLDRDKEFEAYIDKTYSYLLPVLAIYQKFSGQYWIFSLFQMIFYHGIFLYHWVLLVYSTILISKINMILFCQSAHFTLLLQLTPVMTFIFQLKRRQIKRIHEMKTSGFYDYKEPPLVGMDALRSSLKREQRISTVIPLGVGLSAAIILILAPIIDKSAGTFDFSTTSEIFNDNLPYSFGWYPHSTTEGFGLYFALFGQMLVVTLTAGTIATGGFMFLNLALHLILELEMLHLSLEAIEERARHEYVQLFGNTMKKGRRLYSEKQFSFCYSKCLKKNFQHHQIIISGFRIFEDLFSLPIFLSYMIGTIVIALSLISTGSAKELPGTTVCSLLLCGVEAGYMFLFSVIGQRFVNLSQDLRFRIYCIKWYHCTEEVKSSLRIFQAITLRPLTLKAGGFVPANMETFSTVMNSAYSYYNLMNALGVN